jgi:hypothetical protein
MLSDLDLLFIGFKLLTAKIFDGLNYLNTHLGWFSFWMIFLFVGIAIISSIYAIFRYMAVLLILLLSKLCPYREFKAWFVMIASFLFAALFIFNMWHDNGWPNFVMGVSFIVVSFMALSMASSFANVAYKNLKTVFEQEEY